MARIPARKPQGVFLRLVYWATRRWLGKVPAPLGIMAHNKKVLNATMFYEAWSGSAHVLDGRSKELAQIKAAMEIGCRFCVDLGAAIASKNGVTEDELKALIDYRASTLFSERDKRILDYSVAMCACPMVIDDALFAALLADLGEPALVELTAAIAWENHRARFNHAFGAKEEGYTEKSYCLLPQAPTRQLTPSVSTTTETSAHAG